ncbi:hypothetical protein ENSA7_69480 [Enhygromyxa salina]|uniref:Uncharacterized protein n=1 Tax=Enhygromyxa salina TaxID=215803 RepID=A0A2S9XTH3_9BACT|nr:hypothetical protein ENSA7_69480 [Enhygromyxa salina]
MLNARFDKAVSSGLVVDEGCIDEALKGPALLGCAKYPWTENEDGGCVALSGSLDTGESCVNDWGLHPLRVRPCREGLKCLDGRCVPSNDPGKYGTVGSACHWPAPNSCHMFELYCAGESTCQPSLEIGQPCDDAYACVFGAYCKGVGSGSTGVCEPVISQGGACEPQDLNTCERPAEADEAAYCDPSRNGGTCVLGVPGICSGHHPLLRGG